MSAEITIDGESHEIEEKPITVVAHDGAVNVGAPGHVNIDPMNALFRVDILGEQEWHDWRPKLVENFKMVFGDDMRLPASVNTLQAGHLGRRHVVGLLIMIEETLKQGHRPFIRMPETYLHPKQQLGLGDMLIKLATEERDHD